MGPMTTSLLAALLASFVLWRLVVSWREQKRQRAELLDALLSNIGASIQDARLVPMSSAGVVACTGYWCGRRVQVQTIMDTLAVRKLPSWWMSVTITEPVDVNGTINVMMRQSMTASFSNFHLRPHSVRTPPGFPEHAAIKTDRAETVLPLDILNRHIAMMEDRRAKELLITPDGIRLVWLMAEGDRARYGVFRQADFGGTVPTPAFIMSLLARAASLRDDLNARQEVAA